MQVTTHFSFLRGASSPEELFAAAALLGLPGIGVVDRGSVAGVVRAWDAEKTTGVRAIVGTRLDLTNGTALLVYPTVRQKPGSAKGVKFVTIEDETDVANLEIWTKMFKANRRTVLGASMMGVRGQVQREGDFIHVVARRPDDLSPMLASVGGRADIADVYRVSRAGVVKHGMGPDPRDPTERALGKGPRDIYIPDLRLGSGTVPGKPVEGIKIRTRDFR